MKCADPVLCYLDSKGNRKYRNFSFAKKSIHGIPVSHIVFDCGKCLTCRKKRAAELAMRCVLHASLHKENCFITLTYDEKKEGYHNEFEYGDIQRFKKRLRAHVVRHYGRNIKIFNVHEYGRNGKKHWHLIVFNWRPTDLNVFTRNGGNTLFTSTELSKIWPYGFSTIGDVSEASAMYQAKYMEKDFANGNVKSKRQSHSKHQGIGRPYFETHYRQILTLGFIPFAGRKVPVPRYFQKIAHRHYCHYYEPEKFFDSVNRKAIHRPFTKEEPNKEIADLYIHFEKIKNEKIQELSLEWDEVVKNFLTSGEDPDFIKSNSNKLYDLTNRKIGSL